MLFSKLIIERRKLNLEDMKMHLSIRNLVVMSLI